MADISEYRDRQGILRRLGSLEPDTGRQRLFTSAERAEEWDDDKIREVVTDPNRVLARKTFGSVWICNQLSFGSCNGWATAACLARGRYRRGFRDGTYQFSGSYVYAWINGNRDNGSMLSDGLEALEKHGVPPALCVPANKIYRSQMPSNADEQAAKYKGFRLTPLHSIRALWTALAKQDPCVVAIQAGRGFDTLNRDGVAGVDSGRGNHAVCVDDLIWTGSEFFADMPNSWGPGYGTQGRAYLTADHFAQTIGVHGFWTLPTGGTIEG